MIKKIKYLVFSVILLFIFIRVDAYTKDDLVSLASSIKTCSQETSSLVSSFKTTYTRMLNERSVSESDLTKIYNNINRVKNILESNNICSKETLYNASSSTIDELYSLYNETNKIITSSPKYININEETNETVKTNEEVQVVIDSSTKEIRVYEGGTLIDVVGSSPKFNYVGINKIIIGFLLVLLSLLIFMIILRIKGKKSIFITSFIYVLVLLIAVTLVFKNNISKALDTLSSMSVNINNKEKEVVTLDNKIISYPSYDSKYAKIYINDKEEDIYFGDSSSILSKGIGHFSKSSLPGESGTTVLSGHNTGLFKELFNLSKKDKVIIETVYGKFTYKFVDSKIVEDTDIESIEEDYDLILYTCYPEVNLYGNKRLIIYLNLLEEDWLGDTRED